MKRIITAVLCLMLVAGVLTGCGEKVVTSGTTEQSTKAPTQETTEAASPAATTKEVNPVTYESKSTEALLSIADVPAQDLSKVDANYQMAAPAAGDEVAILHTNYGDICIKLFPEAAPMAVENFKALAKAERYDSTIIHRIFHLTTAGISGIQGGDYTQFNGYGGASAFGESFGLEISEYLSNIRGSVAMANTGQPNSNGSQFYVNQGDNSVLDGGYTIFGQVYEGMDVVDAIYSVECDSNDRPLTEVIIDSVEIKTF